MFRFVKVEFEFLLFLFIKFRNSASLDGQIQFVLGTQDSVKWDDGTREGVAPSVSYKAGERQVHIALVCTESPDGDLFPFGEETPNTFTFILRHHCACWNGCSCKFDGKYLFFLLFRITHLDVPPITTTTISTTTHMNTTEKPTTTTTTEKKTTTTTTTTTLVTTTLPLDTAHSSMHAHICLIIVSIVVAFCF